MTSEPAPTTADELLGVPAHRPDRLFARDAAEAEVQWRRLVLAWHPDRSPDPRAAEVFSHLSRLRTLAADWRRVGRWEGEHHVELRAIDGRTHRLERLGERADDLGRLLVGRTTLSLVAPAEHEDLIERVWPILAHLPLGDPAMSHQMAPWLPTPAGRVDTTAERVSIVSKDPESILLADLLDHAGGSLDGRHVAWIVSGMLHVACWLEWAGLTHNAIGPTTWVVCPRDHRGALIGGWAYATRIGAPLVAAPSRTAAAAPSVWRRRGVATPAMDRELIRLTGREAIRNAPAPLMAWLDRPPASRAIDDYRAWGDALRKAYGPPRFTALDITAADIHPEIDDLTTR